MDGTTPVPVAVLAEHNQRIDSYGFERASTVEGSLVGRPLPVRPVDVQVLLHGQLAALGSQVRRQQWLVGPPPVDLRV